MSKQTDLEDRMWSRGFDRRQRNINNNLSKGTESETDYAKTMIKAGLLPFVDAIQQFLDRAWRGTPGVKATAAVKLHEFKDVDVIAFITFKGVIDGASQKKTATQTALQVGHMLEDEQRFTLFEQQDKKHFTNVKQHISDTNHQRYRRNMMMGHMRNRGFVFKSWSKEDKLKVGMKLIDIMISAIGMVKLSTVRLGKQSKTYIEFTQGTMDWIKRQRKNRLACYPLYEPCVEQPIDWTSTTEGGFHTKRLRHIKAIKSKDLTYHEEVTKREPTALYTALNCLQQTKWEINTTVLEIAQSCWDRGIEVGCLIDAEPLPQTPKPYDIDTNEDSRSWWRREEVLRHDQNAHDRMKRYQCIMLLDTATKFAEEPFYHVTQADFTGRIYYISGIFNPQGNDLARSLHRFAEGAAITDEKAKNWLGIAGANSWGLSKCSYEERIEWSKTEGEALARQIASNPESYISIWSKADEPWQFLSWCLDFNELLEQGYGYVSKHPVLLDGTNNGFQHFAAMSLDDDLAAKVNLKNYDQVEDLYEDVKDQVIKELRDLSYEQCLAEDWYKHHELITRKMIKKPVMMIPYSGKTFGIATAVRDYFVSSNEELSWDKDCFLHNHYLAKIIEKSVNNICPKCITVMKYLSDIARCFGQEDKNISWITPSNLYVKQHYYKFNLKRIETKLHTSTVKLSLLTDTKEVDKRKSTQSFAANFVHSLDAANVHLALTKSKASGLNQFCTIHDCFGSTAAHIEEFIGYVKESFVDMYKKNLLEDLYQQAVKQLDDPSKLPIPPDIGDFDVCEVLLAPYVFN